MINMKRACSLAALAVAAALGACSDGLIRPPAPAGPAALSIAASLDLNNGGINEAYQKVNQLSVRVLAGNEVRLQQVVPFDPGATQTVVSLQVPLNETTESFTVELELRASGQALFQGSGTAQLSAGAANQVEIPITPIVTAVTCAGATFQIRVYQAARRITAAALFASGDTVTGVPFTWSSSDNTIVTVDQAGDLRGQRDGTATLTCSARGFSSTRQVQVQAVVAFVQVAPAVDTAVVGTTVPFTATLRDSLSQLITSPRTVNWSSSNQAIATVNASGQATGAAAGTATITATSGTAAGSATLLVIFPPPAVTTLAASDAGATTATLNGRANPQGAATTGWFEWGTDPNLAGAASTATQQLGSGNTDQSFSQQLSGLLANQTYYFRAVANNGGGTVRGGILNFTTRSAPAVRTISGTPEASGAQLQGGVNPQGLAATAWFEWGTSPTLAGAQQTASQQFAAGNRTELPMSASLSNLEPGATYYFRAVASNAVGTSYGQIQSLAANRPPTATTQAASVDGLSASLRGTVNPNGNATTVWFEWATNPALNGAEQTQAQSIGAGTSAVAVSAPLPLVAGLTYYFRVAASNGVGTARGAILSFATLAAPSAVTYSASNLTGTAADLMGIVNPNGAATTAWFEWGTSPSLAGATQTPAVSIGGGASPIPVNRTITGLVPGTTYYFRAAANNQVGTTRGAILSFFSPRAPTVTTLAPASINTGSATLQSQVNPGGVATNAWFEWGVGQAPTSFNSTAAQPIGSGTSTLPVSQALTGLQPATTYSYRAVASNSAGTVRGSLTTFGTLVFVRGTGSSWNYVSGPVGAGYWQVTLFGEVRPSGLATEAWFQWVLVDGPSSVPNFDNPTNTNIVNAGSGTGLVNFTGTFQNVGCDIVWYRAVARNALFGTVYGDPRRTYCEGEF